MNFKGFIAVSLACVTAACATTPQLIVDPSSIQDQSKFALDRQFCTELAEAYKGDTGESTGKAALGGLAAAGLAALVVGPLVFPATLVLSGATGGVLATSGDRKDLKRSREKIIVQCMNDRGYKAYSPN